MHRAVLRDSEKWRQADGRRRPEFGVSVNHWGVCHFIFAWLWSITMVAQWVKRLPPMQETRVRSLGWEDPLEKEMATHSSTLAWKIPWTEKPGRPQSAGSQRVGHNWATSLHYEYSQWKWWNSSWAISNPKRWCCESAALNMSANLENSSGHRTGKDQFSFQSQRKAMPKNAQTTHNCTHFTH